MDNHTLSLLISDHEKDMSGETFSALDWDSLARMAHAEGIGPLLYWKLSKSESFSSLSEETRNFLRLLYASTGIKNQIIFNELESLARSFQQAGIAVVALKGVCFALTVYPDIALRPMGDMDLLVPKAKLADAIEIAKSLDYRNTMPDASPGLSGLLSHEIHLQKSGAQSIMLELHHSLVAVKAYSYAVPVDWFWEQTEPLKPSSSKMFFEDLLMLTPEAQILFAAGHAMLQHGRQFSPMRWFYDLDRLIRLYNARIDWDLLLSQARAFEWGSALDETLKQTVAYFNTPVPERVLASLSEVSDRYRGLVEIKPTRLSTHTLLEHHKLLSLNAYGRFRRILALLIPSPSYMRWRYQLKSMWFLPVYYLFRWWGILKDAVRTVSFYVLPGLQKKSPK
jgi:hypothetical protein